MGMDPYELALPHGFVALVDYEDSIRDLSCEFKDGFIWRGYLGSAAWYASKKPHTHYVTASVHRNGRQYQLRLHRVLAGAAVGQLVDHRDGNGLNNRQDNLRIADATGNSRNRGLNPGREFKGVSFHKQARKWTAQIRICGKLRYIGLFPTVEEAARAYDQRAVKEFGEYARLNYPVQPVTITTEPTGVVEVRF